MNLAHSSPRLENRRTTSVTTPPTFTTPCSSPSSASSFASAIVWSVWRRSAPAAPSSGWSETYRPSISFSNRSRSVLANSWSGTGSSVPCQVASPSPFASAAAAKSVAMPASCSRRRSRVRATSSSMTR